MDIGCGQGRDALFIARLGHAVVGVDLSPTGIAEMCAIADEEDLNINGIAADITEFVPEGMFDVILFDRTLHMLPKAPRLTVLSKLIAHVAPNGWVLIADENQIWMDLKRSSPKIPALGPDHLIPIAHCSCTSGSANEKSGARAGL